MKFNSFLENYSMKSTYALQVGFLSSLTIVNEGSSLMIINETTNFKIEKQGLWKTSILKNNCFKNDHFWKTNFLKQWSFLKTIVSFSIFCRRFHNEAIVFLKNKNVNIPKQAP